MLISSGDPRSNRRTRPLLERLEGRWAPALSYHGGALLDNVQIEGMYYSPWNTNGTLSAQHTTLDSAFGLLTNSTYMDLLAPYSVGSTAIGPGTFNGDDTNFPTATTTAVLINGNSYNAISDNQIQSDLSQEINLPNHTNNLTTPNANTLFTVFTPPGVVVTTSFGNSVNNFTAYHRFFHDAASGKDVVYAVMSYPDGHPNAVAFPLTPLQTLEVAASHELAEAITDPKGNAWFDNAQGSEIGDLCAFTWGTLGGYVVQNLFSNATNSCAMATGSNFFIGTFQNPTEGQFTGPVARFVDASGSGQLSFAEVSWSDGTHDVLNAPTVQRVNSTTFDLIDSHVFSADEGTVLNSYIVMTLADGSQAADIGLVDNPDSNGSHHFYLDKGQVTLTDPAVVGTPGSISTTAGSPFGAVVATFTDPSGSEPNDSIHYSATIDWGDSTGTSTGTITFGNGTFTIKGNHTYSASSAYTVTATINHEGTITKIHTPASVITLTPPIVTVPRDQNAAEGTSGSLNLGSFSDSNNGPWTVTVNWGDGTSSSINPNTAGPLGSLSHTYTEEGTASVTITVNNTGDSMSGSGTFQVTVSDPPVLGVPVNVNATTGAGFSGAVATFTDPGGSEANDGSHYQVASIDWGDGSPLDTSSGTISKNGNAFTVNGTHTYNSSYSFTITTTVSHEGMTTLVMSPATASISSTGTMVVSSANPSVFGQAVTFTVTVIGVGHGGPTGTVTFFDSANSIGRGMLSTSNGMATASLTTSALFGGTHTITASYSGDSTFLGSMGTLTQSVRSGSINTTTTVSANPSPVAAGQPVTFTATVAPQFFTAGGSVQFQIDGLNIGTPVTPKYQGSSFQGMATLTATVAVASGPHTLTALYSGDTRYGNSAGSTTLTVTPGSASADLSVTKTGPNAVVAGNQLTYTIVVTNNGPHDAQTVSLSDLLPAGESFVLQSQSGPDTFTLSHSGNQVTDTIGTLPSGHTDTITLVVTIGAGVADGTQLSNTATISSATADPNPNNDSSTTTTTVSNNAASADLAVTKTGPAMINAGSQITYTIVVTNNGPNDAQTVSLSDLLPAGESFVSQSQSGPDTFTLSHSGNQVTDTIATLPNGNSDTITIIATVGAGVANGTQLSNTATVSSATTDPTPNNNSSTTTTTVMAATTGSGNVTTSLNVFNGQLTISGDSGNNAFTLTELGSGRFQISGAGTTVNHSSNPVTVSSVTAITVTLQNGNENMTILGNGFGISGDLVITAGSGSDTFTVKGFACLDLSLRTSSAAGSKDMFDLENDAITGNFGTGLTLDDSAGTGNDTVTLSHLSIASKLAVSLSHSASGINVLSADHVTAVHGGTINLGGTMGTNQYNDGGGNSSNIFVTGF